MSSAENTATGPPWLPRDCQVNREEGPSTQAGSPLPPDSLHLIPIQFVCASVCMCVCVSCIHESRVMSAPAQKLQLLPLQRESYAVLNIIAS